VLLGTTPQGNTCLHIACIHSHKRFCEDVLAQTNSQQSPAAASLLGAVNADGETPLLAAVTSGHVSLASFILGRCREEQLNEAILTQDKRGFNALHHAIRSGHRKLALELIDESCEQVRRVAHVHRGDEELRGCVRETAGDP
jgi:ankyrin repeat protein